MAPKKAAAQDHSDAAAEVSIPDLSRSFVPSPDSVPVTHNTLGTDLAFGGPAAPDAAEGGDQALAGPAAGDDPVGRLIRREVEKYLKQALSNLSPDVARQVSTPVAFDNRPQAPEPPKFLKHYRNDTHPDIKIARMNMEAERPQSEPLAGYMEFHRGHFYATDENDVAQLDWMMEHPRYTPDGRFTIGGNPEIYEDDGSQLWPCSMCERVFASEKGWKAHIRATHGG